MSKILASPPFARGGPIFFKPEPEPTFRSANASTATSCTSLSFPNLNYRGGDKSLALPTSRIILFDGENISFDASLVIYIYIYK
jgi:hypothetical protein